MKQTGVVRNLDKLGRVVIPIELRRTFDIKTDDPVEILADNKHIILRKYEPACTFCGREDEVTIFEGKNVCKFCIDRIKNL